MAMSKEKAEKNAKKYAVTCCRFEAGTVVSAETLEDPAIFDDLVESGLLTLGEETLKIEEVIGLTFKNTVDALSPITKDMVEGYVAKEETVEIPVVENTAPASNKAVCANSGVLKINIAKGEGINIELPLSAISSGEFVTAPAVNEIESNTSPTVDVESDNSIELRNLEKKYYKINAVGFGNETFIGNGNLVIRKDICDGAVKKENLVKKVSLEIITEDNYDVHSETIMDVQPIAVKESGELGSGVTRVLDNVVVVLTGIDENGVQIGEFGSSEGSLLKNIMWGRPGAPDRGDILIKAEVVIEAETNMERPGPLAAHKAMEVITAEIREALLASTDLELVKTENFIQKRNKGKKRVLVVKEIMGQGAMHDNIILPTQPAGIMGGVPNVDLGNLPVILSPLELLDGGIHALTCIGPASKENTRHYFREPLVKMALESDEIDFLGVAIVGSPQANTEKDYVSKRLGMLAETMDLDGAIITTEGFGNNHIDFASHHEEIGKRGAKVVGVTYSAVQGALVVGNEYMYALVDNNKSDQGIENEILCNNTLCAEDATRALAMLTHLMEGGELEEPERKWNKNIKLNNVSVIENVTGNKLELADNEQVLPKSKKRLEIYEVE
ncbi:MAG: D-proline reductase (dithiol) proprotein PrdA [Bacilli bacterium]